jgi:hypothetical protein
MRLLLAAGGFQSRVAGVAVCALLAAASACAQQEQAFRGVIADSTCATAAGHTPMLRPAETMADCTIACVKKGAKYVLFSSDNGMVYQLNDQAKPKAFAARMVAVIGNLDSATRTIRISDIIPALPPKVMHAKFIYLDCGACAGGLAKARQAALLEVQDWKRFDVVPDRRKADLIFQLSENRYLGDFDPGKGSVAVAATQMTVTDPATEEILWSDSVRSGYMFESRAARDLIDNFRVELQAQEGDLAPLLRRDKSLVVKPPAQPGK